MCVSLMVCMDNTAIFLTVNYKFLLHDKNEHWKNLVTS